MVGAGLAKYYMAIDVNFSRGQVGVIATKRLPTIMSLLYLSVILRFYS